MENEGEYFRAWLTIISTAFPNVVLISTPIVCPTLLDSSSVEYDISDARGSIAKKLNTKMVAELHPNESATMPRGTHGRR